MHHTPWVLMFCTMVCRPRAATCGRFAQRASCLLPVSSVRLVFSFACVVGRGCAVRCRGAARAAGCGAIACE
eukprot:1784117-Prymnesium_polylepis.1